MGTTERRATKFLRVRTIQLGLVGLALVMLAFRFSRLVAAFEENLIQRSMIKCLMQVSGDRQPKDIHEFDALLDDRGLFKAVALHISGDARFSWILGQAYFLAGHYAEAASVLDLSVDGVLPLVHSPEQQFDYAIIRALVNQRHRRWFEAVDWFRKASSLEPDRFSQDFDADYKEATLCLLEERVAHDTGDVISQYLLAKHLSQGGNLEEAVPHARFVIDHSEGSHLQSVELGEAYFLLGQHLARQGEPLSAHHYYLESVLDNFPAPEAVRALLASPDTSSQDTARKIIGGLQPAFAVNKPVGDKWILQGFTLSEKDLELGGPFKMWFFWKPRVAVAIDNPSWSPAGTGWVQEARVSNLAPNAGFEWGTGYRESYPFGYPVGIYPEESRAQHQVIRVTRGGQETLVAVIRNKDAPTRKGGLASLMVSVHPDSYYLQGGWVKSEDGNPFLGRQWLLPPNPLDPDLHYDFVPCRLKVDTWQYCAGVTKPFGGANRCQVWLLNYDSSGTVCFDNLLFIEIRDPCAQNGIKCSATPELPVKKVNQ